MYASGDTIVIIISLIVEIKCVSPLILIFVSSVFQECLDVLVNDWFGNSARCSNASLLLLCYVVVWWQMAMQFCVLGGTLLDSMWYF